MNSILAAAPSRKTTLKVSSTLVITHRPYCLPVPRPAATIRHVADLVQVQPAAGEFGQQGTAEGNGIAPLAAKLVREVIPDARQAGVPPFGGALELLVGCRARLENEYSKAYEHVKKFREEKVLRLSSPVG